MKSMITWKWTDLPVTEDDIKEAQIFLGMKMPCSLKNLFKTANGGKPSRTMIIQEDQEDLIFDSLLNVKKGTDESLYILYPLVRNLLPETLIPFGLDPFGNIFCIHSSDQNDDEIFLFLHDADINKNMIYISRSLKNFINLLN